MSDNNIDDEAIARAEAARQAQILSAMQAEGVGADEPQFEDYFGFAEDHKVMLPDGKQYIIHSSMNEGARRQYLNSQNRDVTVERVTGNAKMKVQQGEERYALLKATITGWNLMRRDPKTKELLNAAYSDKAKEDFLKAASPRIIDLIEKDVRKHNPWLMAGATSEDIKAQIKELEEQYEAKVAEEAGNAS